MGILSKNSGKKSNAASATLIAKGCTVNGKIKLESNMQGDGFGDGQVHIEGELIIADSGRIKGEIFAKQLIVNGIIEGNCHVEHIQILAIGLVKGKVWSNNL